MPGRPWGRPGAGPSMGVLWLGLMVIWLAALLVGAWGVWPHVERLVVTADLIIALAWLVIGGAAWVMALRLGIQRYWRR
jgi:hypothetical protein